MPGLDRKRRGELLRAVFDVLADHRDGIQARDALREVESRLGLTEFEAANYPGSHTRRFEKSVRFQTINAVKAGWMTKRAGIWTATAEGLAAHLKFTDPEQFLVEAQKLYRVWVAAQPSKELDGEDEGEPTLSDAPSPSRRPRKNPGNRCASTCTRWTRTSSSTSSPACSGGWDTV